MKWHGVIAFVIVVAGVDAWFSLLDARHLAECEANPLALWLIEAGGVNLLVSGKVAGTAAVVHIVGSMRLRWPRAAWCGLWSVAAVQCVVVGTYLARML